MRCRFVASLVVVGAVAACGGDAVLPSTTPASTTPATSSTTAPPTTVSTTTSTLPPAGLGWYRVDHDEAVFGGPGNQAMYSVAAGGPGLVAVGSDESGGDADAAVWTSVDGLAWSRVPHDEAAFGGRGAQVMWAAAAGGPGLVAVGFDESGGDPDAAVWTSVDGLAWSRVPDDGSVLGGPDNQFMWGVAAVGPGLVAVGDAGPYHDRDAAVWTSVDGLAWSRIPHDEAAFGGPGGQVMRGITAGGPGLVAVGHDDVTGNPDAAVWVSVDGLAWSRVPDETGALGGPAWQGMGDVVAGNLVLVAVGYEGPEEDRAAAVWASVDGLSWSRFVGDASALHGCAFQEMYRVVAGGPGLVVVGSACATDDQDAAVWLSVDGLSWLRVPDEAAGLGGPGGQGAGSVARGGPGLVAVGYDTGGGDSDAAVWYSGPRP